MFGVGWLLNRLSAPTLVVKASTPDHVPVGQATRISVELTNAGRLPASDLHIGLAESRSQWRRLCQAHCTPIEWLPAGFSCRISDTMTWEERGIHRLPSVWVDHYFPFYLFRSTRSYVQVNEVAVTPLPSESESDPLAGQLRSHLEGIVRSRHLGDLSHYVGSREYQVGMPVRRWDFASWARLGKPIVRQYSAPSSDSVLLIVDTSCDDTSGEVPSRLGVPRYANVERLLRNAAYAIEFLSEANVPIYLCVTTQEESKGIVSGETGLLLSELASAESCLPAAAATQLSGALRDRQAEHAIVLSTRGSETTDDRLLNSVIWITVSEENRHARPMAQPSRVATAEGESTGNPSEIDIAYAAATRSASG